MNAAVLAAGSSLRLPPWDFADFGASGSVFEGDGDGSTFPNVVDERRSETSDAYSAVVTDTGINDTGGRGLKHPRSQIL